MRGDPLQADEAKLFFLPLKREEFVLQAEEAGGATGSGHPKPQ